MAHRIPRPLNRPMSCLAAAAAVGIGCAPSKTVTLRTTPDRATVLLYRVPTQGPEVPVELDGDDAKTPTTVKLDFGESVDHYRVEAHRVLCAPNLDTPVRRDPEAQTTYDIPLTQFKEFVDAMGYAAQKGSDIWRLAAGRTQTTATIDTTEPPSPYADQPVPVTDDKEGKYDYPSFAVAAGPTGTLMVYEEVRENSGIPGGLDSRLWKLSLAADMNPTLLTTNRKQQHNPAFSYSGDSVIFDTDDDSRTRSPVQFKVESDESTVEHLEHDADTCETEFTTGRDALAFTAYTPNAPGPQVMVSARDGSGATQRGLGTAPQISPDGNRIVFVHTPEGGGHKRLAVVNVRGPITTGELQLDADHDAVDPHWSPDGKLIVYSSDLRDGKPVDLGREPNVNFREPDETHSFLWLVASDGRNPVQLTHGESFDSHPVFDPNGRTIYFRSNRGGQWNIWKCNLTDLAIAKVGAR